MLTCRWMQGSKPRLVSVGIKTKEGKTIVLS